MPPAPALRHARGFTIIELSIVLVIIGLILGGVLVGRELIHAAEIRATISQVEGYNTAVHVFQDRYNGLPGDLTVDAAAQFGMTPRDTVNDTYPHGDGVIEGCGLAGTVSFGCEAAMFWEDLSTAGLIQGNFNTAGDSNNITANSGQLPLYIPAAKLGGGTYFSVLSDFGTSPNYYLLNAVSSFNLGGYVFSGIPAVLGVTPGDALNIDTKMDDGSPLTGTVQASNGLVSPAFPSAPAVGVCVSNAAGNPYNTSTSSYATSPACALLFRLN